MAREISSAFDLHKIVYVSRATREGFANQEGAVAKILTVAPGFNLTESN
jgi:hypothetical protein